MRIGVPELLLLLFLAILLLGARRIPELGAALGKALREFRKAEKDEDKEILPHEKDGKNDNATHDKK
ncbi:MULTISPECIES: twin-arginine translocase TatA/TatE family subunit [Fibrobacter]|uniref:Sec-independent protein translocase protein TatA n=1 Tax=Fibrobacter intestinalis TaxID=28122 RepID=A0A1M6UR63_9BACT|nr:MULTISPECIES: twin-arginine translocase TatA/TatE family subunit [Fibrobacter]PBC67820.1 sec-independent protein translocase protein TatA [Fibrobacter sp. UWS1]SHK71634.1 sec-independent protein translocase protein TatA [Fibrobacter intestinalis]